MVALFDADALFVTPEKKTRGQAPSIRVLDRDGTTVAVAHDRAGAAAIGARFVGFLGRTSPAEWDVVDTEGNRLLDVAKPVERMRGPSPRVSLVDGTPLGSAVAERLRGIPEVSLLGQGDRSLGRLEPATGERRSYPILMYRIRDAEDGSVGEVAQQTRGTWGFHLVFEPDADLAVRALVLAYTLCLVHQRMTGSRI